MRPHAPSVTYCFVALALAFGIHLGFVYCLWSGWPTSAGRLLGDLLNPVSQVWLFSILPTFGLLVLLLVLWPKRIIYTWPAALVIGIFIASTFVRLSKA